MDSHSSSKNMDVINDFSDDDDEVNREQAKRYTKFLTCNAELELDSSYESELHTDYDAVGEYFFESARLAYKADPDYKNMVQAVVVMEACRKQAERDLQKIREHYTKASMDPVHYVDKIKANDNFEISGLGKVRYVPNIDQDKYGTGKNDTSLSKYLANRSSSTQEGSRKRKRDSDQVSNFNKPWTDEEQSRLEELLLIYPPEETKSSRWEKIANALGGRTPAQIASRVQKYFIKLMRAGVPVPEYMPNPSYMKKKNTSHRRLSKASTTYSADDESSRTSFTTNIEGGSSDDDAVSDIEDIDPKLRCTPEYQELLKMKKALQQKTKHARSEMKTHNKCQQCGCTMNSIRMDCSENNSPPATQFCDNCANK